MTAMAATIGMGNIAGVATAVTIGGPVQYFGCGLPLYSVWQQSMPRQYLQ